MNSNIIQKLSVAGVVLPEDQQICSRAKLDTGTLCNYKCYFCYYKSQLNVNTPFDIIKKRIDKLYSLGCRDFDLSGGESSIHPDFFKILEYLNKLQVNVSCLTNGFKFSDINFMRRAVDLGINDILFSLHSVGKIHDEIVGKKRAFNKIMQAIENAKKLNIRIRFNSTITNKNYRLVDNEYFDVVEQLEPFEMNFLPLNYFAENNKKFGINYNIILEPIKKFIDKSKIKYINVRYVPFCYMVGYEKHVVGYFQHIYDIYDWNICYYDYIESNLDNLRKKAIENRCYSYIKDDECKKCKYFYICDGYEKFVDSKSNPQSGEKIKNVLNYRMDFWK